MQGNTKDIDAAHLENVRGTVTDEGYRASGTPFISDPELDALLARSAEVNGALAVRRFYAAITAIGGDGSELILPMEGHVATLGRALTQAEKWQAIYPRTSVNSVVLIFDPRDPQQVARHALLVKEAEDERVKGAQ